MKRLALLLTAIASLALAEGNIEVPAVATSVTSAVSDKLSVGYKLVVCTVATHYRTGTSTVASTTTDLSIPANTPWQIVVRPADRYIAFVLDSGTGSCSIYHQPGDGKNPPPEHASPGLDPFTATTANISGALSVGGNIVSGGTVSGGFDGGVGRFSAVYISGTLGLAGRATLGDALWALEVDAGTVNADSANLSTANVGGEVLAGLFTLDAGSGNGLVMNGNKICADGACLSFLRPVNGSGRWDLEAPGGFIVAGAGGIQTGDGDGITDYLVLVGSDGGFANMYSSGSTNASMYLGTSGTGRIRLDAPVEARFRLSGQEVTAATFDGGAVLTNSIRVKAAPGTLTCDASNVMQQVTRTTDGGTFWYLCDGNGFWNFVSKGLEDRIMAGARPPGPSIGQGTTIGGFRPGMPGKLLRLESLPLTAGTGAGYANWTVQLYRTDAGISNVCNHYTSCTAGNANYPDTVACSGVYDPWNDGVLAATVGYDGGCTTVPDVRLTLTGKRGVATLPAGD